MIVVDSSAILAHVFSEPSGDTVLDWLEDAAILSVNISEVILKMTEKGWHCDDAAAALQAYGMAEVPFDTGLAIEAARLHMPTRQLGLSLGDKACLALAIREGATAITTDRKWSRLDVGCKIEVIR